MSRILLLRRRRSQKGAVAVEAALVTWVVLLLVFGILELAFLMRDYVAVTSSARAGARIASTGANAGPCTPATEDEVPCPGFAAPNLAQMAADEIGTTGTVLPKDSIRYIMVYKANENGFPGSHTSMPGLAGCTTECVAYRWYPAQDRFRYAQGSWDSRQISACLNPALGPLDAVGVQVVVEHAFLSGIFGSSLTLSDHAVVKFEPLTNNACAAGEHL
jgi:hypothetical protein